MDEVTAAKKHARIDYLASLDGDPEIPKLSPSVVARAHELIDMLSSANLAVVPTGDGEIMFEWYDDGHVLGDITLSSEVDGVDGSDGSVYLT